ncbi:hypothetical protein L6452_33641 [Arctium lappa]|uniref:Uncharacterized protein n=1 Tax=Arctium lappa TaxID=4217 RepID=A0ACB8YGM5_ARCLA|nr:hypothetical protein L6452_33641 [Arctium lappa]
MDTNHIEKHEEDTHLDGGVSERGTRDLQVAAVVNNESEVDSRYEKRSRVITSEELLMVIKHYGLKKDDDDDRDLGVESFFGCGRLWPWLLHKFLNIFFPIVSIILFTFIFPILLLFRLCRFCVRSVFREKLAGKVVLITGASSGIGEHLAYEYAKHGASLVLVARREELLTTVARKAMEIGSPDAIVVKADVSKLQDCKRFVDEAIKHFGKVDCLVNNAGTGIVGLFEDQLCITDHASVMDINFWGSVNATHFALPHLKKSKGRIVVIGSCGGWFATSGVSVYNASKVAQQSFFETLRIELGSDIGITMVTLGMVDTPLANDDFLTEANLKWLPKESVEGCAKAIVNSAIRGDEYLTEPGWMHTVFLWVILLSDLMYLIRRFIVVTSLKTSLQKWKSLNTGSFQPLDLKHN